MLGTDMLTYGAIIDPETGCYALIHATTFSRYSPVAIHAGQRARVPQSTHRGYPQW